MFREPGASKHALCNFETAKFLSMEYVNLAGVLRAVDEAAQRESYQYIAITQDHMLRLSGFTQQEVATTAHVP